MCGIVAAAARRDIVLVLLEGLRKLEYRGYDSAGLAVLNGGLHRLRTTERVAELAEQAAREKISGVTGIAHTRWATHGVPSERNAHPHVSGGLAVVHNGIIENFEILRRELEAKGFYFESETDTEVIAHLIQSMMPLQPDLVSAVGLAMQRLIGAYAIAVIRIDDPAQVVVARKGSPLLLGIGGGDGNEGMPGCFAASDASALLQVTRQIIYLENGDLAELSANEYRIFDAEGRLVERPVVMSHLTADAVDLGHYRHYMQKEIFEQPDALANTLEMLGGARSVQPGVFGAGAEGMLASAESVLILACGTSSHAGMVARYWIESLAGVPCTVEVASEYRYRKSVPNPRQLIVVVSQSGETADTLAALHHARALGHTLTLAICNVPESAIIRETAMRFVTRAGTEIGVASTKAFTTQLVVLFLLALLLAKLRGRLSAEVEAIELDALLHLPVAVGRVLELEEGIQGWAKSFANKHHALFLGRGSHYPIALEGALKLKEISYIHAEAYPAGELKHGPLALIDADMPVVAVAPNNNLLEKLKSNLQEVRARGGELYVFADADSAIGESDGVHVIRLPEHYGKLSPLLHVIPLQLLAYHVALVRGTDVDKPRNLAKSVTVE